MEANVKEIIKNYDILKSQRSIMETNWDDLHWMWLSQADEVLDKSPDDAKVDRKLQYTDEPYQALQILSAGLHSYLTGPTNSWFALRAKDKDLRNNDSITRYLEQLEEVLRASISNTNFETEQDEFYSSSACYGTAVMYIEEDDQDDLRFNTIPIKDIFFAENARGKVDTFNIRFPYTAAQAVDRFGIENVHESIKKVYENAETSSEKYEFMLKVSPRHVRDDSKKDVKNMPISVVWVDVQNKKIMQEGGLLESPFAYHRFYKRKSSPYGYSPCMMAMKSAKQLNATLKITVRAMSMAIDGPMDVPANSYVGKIDLNPGKLNYRRGDEGMTPIRTSTQIGQTDWLVNYYTDAVKDGLFNKAIIALGDVTKRMHGLEVQELITEKMVLLGPAVGRFLDEFAGNVITRSLAILARRGKLPEPPEDLGEDFEYKIEFISPLAKAQRNNELQSINVVLESAGGMANLTPEVIDNLDPDATLREIGDVTGATKRIFRKEAKVKEIREARVAAQAKQQEEMQTQQGLDQAQQVKEIEATN